jgi:hypothetical protein
MQIYFKLQMVFTHGSITTTIQHTNTQVTYKIHISHNTNTDVTQNGTTKQTNKKKQISSQSYTNSEGQKMNAA